MPGQGAGHPVSLQEVLWQSEKSVFVDPKNILMFDVCDLFSRGSLSWVIAGRQEDGDVTPDGKKAEGWGVDKICTIQHLTLARWTQSTCEGFQFCLLSIFGSREDILKNYSVRPVRCRPTVLRTKSESAARLRHNRWRSAVVVAPGDAAPPIDRKGLGKAGSR